MDGEGGLFSRFENLTYYAQFGTKADEVVGVLRWTDVVKKILDGIKTCPVTSVHTSEEQSDNLAA